MIGGISGVTIPNIHFVAASSGKMPVPVDPSSMMYSNFEFVSGVPAPEGSSGVSISRLHILNVLIGQLNQAGRDLSLDNVSPFDGIDALMEEGRIQLLEARDASSAMPYLSDPNTQGGLLFTLSA